MSGVSPSRTWITEAEDLKDLTDELLFQTEAIKRFLDRDRICWLISSKGMGKTLLLRFKRKHLEQTPTLGQPSLTIIPRDKTADYVKLPAFPALDHTGLMTQVPFWADLWEMSIALSVLLHFSPRDDTGEESAEIIQEIARMRLPVEIARNLTVKFRHEKFRLENPSDILDVLLRSNVSDLQRIRDLCAQPIYRLYSRFIRSGVAVFIDSFDQALASRYPRRLDIWIAGQWGLMKAAHEIARQNPHIKTYISIRQEAYASHDDSDAAAMDGSTLMIRYTAQNLEELFTNSIQYFEGVRSITTFAGGLHAIDNDHARCQEEIFRYVLRHSVGTPRSLMVIGKAISEARIRPDLPDGQRVLRRVVNETAADFASKYLFGEMIDLLPAGLNTKTELERFLRMLTANVLSANKLKRISARFASGSSWPSTQVDGPHPFCALFNIGLLGLIEGVAGSTELIQSFQKPYEFKPQMRERLLESDFYFLHPSLESLVRRSYNPNLHVSRVIIGDEYAWSEENGRQVGAEQAHLFVSYSAHDRDLVEAIVAIVEEQLDKKGRSNDIWFDQWKLQGGEWIQENVEKGLASADFVVAILTPHSLESGWVTTEWRTILDRDITHRRAGDGSVIPVLIGVEPAQIPEFLRGKHAVRFRRDQPEKMLAALGTMAAGMARRLQARGQKAPGSASTSHSTGAPY